MTKRIEGLEPFCTEGNLALVEALEVRDETCHRAIVALETPKKHLSEAKILIVDDRPDMREMLRDVVCQYGASENLISFAGTGMVMCEKVNNETFDLILSDNHMPGKYGSEALAELNSDRKLENTFVIMWTSDPAEVLPLQGKIGAHHILDKGKSKLSMIHAVLQERFAC